MNDISKNIVEILNKYSDSKQDGSFLNDYLLRAKDSDPIIPVLGMQGVGKSTLINALLEENILPNEADETTCVPVEIKYGEDEHADVFYKESNNSIVVNTIEELRDFVDNKYNPANEKGVSRIVLYRNREILKSGIIIVDLPGVGSVTSANEETTITYIQNLCTAIFVIPTVPTIRKNEALFIKGVWSQFSKAIFVQNEWGESKQEIEESVVYNTKLLRGIADGLNNKFDNKILVVNAYNAIAGSLRRNLKLRESSNINSLVEAINDFATNWRCLQAEGVKEKTLMTIDSAIDYAKKILQEFSQNREEVVKNREKELLEKQNTTNKLEDKVSQINGFLGDKEASVRLSARSKASDCIKKIRAAMNKAIDSGVCDGDALSEVFKDVQEENVTECLNLLFDEITQIKIEVDEMIQDLCNIAIENDLKVNPEMVQKDHQVRYEKGLNFLFKIGGGIGGGIAGVKVGAAVGSAFAPGVGTAVGIAVGLVIGVVGSVVGSFAKRKVQDKRSSETKREIEPYYSQIESAIKKTISEKFNFYSCSVKSALDMVISERRTQEKLAKDGLYIFEDADQIENIEKDIKLLIDYKSLL